MSDDKEQRKNINLWMETIETLKSHNLSRNDVKTVIVSEKDRELVCELIENPPEPNDALRGLF